MKKILFFLFVAIFITSCNETNSTNPQKFTAENEKFQYSGRHQKLDKGTALIASAASVKANVLGDTAVIYLQSGNEQHHYVTVELNAENMGRFRIKNDSLSFALNPEKENLLAVFKNTEAANGSVIFKGISAEKIEAVPKNQNPKIEFIGNSITCGMGADTRNIPCEAGEWYDQHNAYLAYGPRVARALNANFELTCVSGMGMYRNWNDEDQPVMPEVYENLHLNTNDSQKTDFSNAPDVVSIALGTNDLSLGDGEKQRQDFNREKFIVNYISFIEMIYGHYPNVKIALLSSPMLGEKEREILTSSLKEIKNNFPKREMAIFEFKKMDPQGCTYHPNIQDHEEMANRLIPFFKNLLEQ